ncbi:hypothetical protein C7B62_02950 [Pleurocapsa sp. CCALA 161]|uniref:hypothetical protein n=1 Tax=Pleurocapsa sp. CCALA 161 TaxID=2107688 RepID=UPI000D04994B|nr:hypothetical protein [Pleurocapsa sp. CCALA 161]PSB12213.1 hypothetical protein C7B62_02950 [Pleurocapsa sp. CCALA 161]
MKIIDNLIPIIENFCLTLSNQRTEPKVWQKCDHQGNSYWLTFDPITGLSSYFCNEKEVRMWLDQYHYSQKNR